MAPHPFYVLGGSIGEKLTEWIDCFDAIELCHFWTRLINPNKRAVETAERFGKPLIATSDAHQLHAFGSNYTSIPRPAELTVDQPHYMGEAGFAPGADVRVGINPAQVKLLPD
jgi:nicotinamidase-related amidase